MMDRADAIERLRTMPGRLRSALAREAGGQTNGAGAGEWSAREVFDHIRATDILHTGHIFMIVAGREPPIAGGDERELAERAGFAEDDLETALTAYAARRGELVRLLVRLAEAGWQRAGVHPAWGRTTIERYARHVAAHEGEHLAQIERLPHPDR